MSTLVRWSAPAPTAASPRTRPASAARAAGAPSSSARPRLQGRRRTVVLWGGGAVALVVLAVVVAVVLKAKSDRDARQRAADARAVAVERVRLTKLQAPHRGAAPDLAPGGGRRATRQRLAARAALVKAVEDADHARRARACAPRRARQGPIRGSQCGPFLRAPDAVPDDRVLTKAIGRYDCVAVQGRHQGRRQGSSVGSLGYPFVAALDFRRFTYVWCRNTPPQSERGPGAGVRPPRPRLSRREGPRARHRLRGRAGLVARVERVSGCAGAAFCGLDLRPRLLLAALLVAVRRLPGLGRPGRRGGAWPPARASPRGSRPRCRRSG